MLFSIAPFFFVVFWFIYVSVLLPISFWVFLILVGSSLFGLDTGIHRAYINLLLKIFDYVRVTLEESEGKKHANQHDSEDEDAAKVEAIYPHQEEKDPDSQNNNSLYQRTLMKLEKQASNPEKFQLDRIAGFLNAGIQAIIDDDVTKRFSSSSLKTWNLLTRTNKSFYQFSSGKLFLYWSLGTFYRFLIFFPFRLFLMIFSLFFILISTYLIGYIPEGQLKRFVYHRISILGFRLFSRTVSTIVTVHNPENKPRSGGICVANHTSPFDVIILSCDNSYALVGQKHGGVLGLMERALNRATDHVFFDRFQVEDREFVCRKLKEHASDPNKLPILIFPEGTCINNSAVFMFKKGAFEASDTIYPVRFHCLHHLKINFKSNRSQ